MNSTVITSQSLQPTEEEKAALRKKRELGIRKLGSLGLLMMGCSLVAIIIGAASIGVQASDPTPPYMIGLALIAGVLMMITGGLAWMTAKQGQQEKGDEVSSSVKCYFIAFFVVGMVAAIFCLLIALAGGVVGIVLCALEGTSDKLKDICQPHHDANLALSVLTLLVCLALFVLGIMGTCFVCFYGRTLGFKNRREQRAELMMKRMERQQAEMARGMQQMQETAARYQQSNAAYSGH